jgi:hypothetical protein
MFVSLGTWYSSSIMSEVDFEILKHKDPWQADPKKTTQPKNLPSMTL